MSNKAKNIKRHFTSRCMERVGLFLNPQQLVQKIQKNELPFIKKTSNTRTVWGYYCEFNKKEYRIVYDKLRHDVVTIYPVKERIKNV